MAAVLLAADGLGCVREWENAIDDRMERKMAQSLDKVLLVPSATDNQALLSQYKGHHRRHLATSFHQSADEGDVPAHARSTD